MRYPIITPGDATRYLLAERDGTASEVESIVQYRGSGEELDQWFIKPLREGLDRLCGECPNFCV